VNINIISDLRGISCGKCGKVMLERKNEQTHKKGVDKIGERVII